MARAWGWEATAELRAEKKLPAKFRSPQFTHNGRLLIQAAIVYLIILMPLRPFEELYSVGGI